MGILFISHSSADNNAAIKVRGWLKENGWGEVFLDLDPQRGLAPGQHWEQELKQAGERCSGVLILISPAWVESRWCQAEFLAAKLLGKKIFPVFVAPTSFDSLPVELKASFQIADISDPEKEADGFERLAIGLKRAGLDPQSFPWPPAGDPHRVIYRGLQSLEEQDAAIFFGRDRQITEGLDALRRMRDGATKRMLVILGASGAGKSSFLKAGLIARLKRDEENFLVLPVVRPEQAALSGKSGLAASLGRDPAQLNGREDLVEALAQLRKPVMDRLARFAQSAGEASCAKPPTIVIAIDQAEELFAGENVEAGRALELLAEALRADADTLAVATIRADSFEKLQSEPRLTEVLRLPFDLPPLTPSSFKEVIEGPARLASPPVHLEAELTEQLLKDLADADALPLLAFTLERLSLRHRGEGRLTLAYYAHELGGLKGAIMAAVDAAFAASRDDPALPHTHAEIEQLARAAFIPALVQLDDADAEPGRRVELLRALPESTLSLVRHLIDQRLLVGDTRLVDGAFVQTVEVAHEAILRQWPALRAWIAEERDALRALDGVRAAAAEWKKHEGIDDPQKGRSWLAHRGGRLAEAEELLARPGFAGALGATERGYLSACRASENDERLLERQRIARTRRLQRNIGGLIAIVAVIVLLAGAGVAQLLAGLAARRSDTLAALAAKESGSGNYDLAVRYGLAGLAAADWPFIGRHGSSAEAELNGAADESSALAVLRGHEGQVNGAAFSPDGKRIVTASFDETARIWDAETGTQIAVLRHPLVVRSAAFSPDGRRIVTASIDNTARIWNADTGVQMVLLSGHRSEVESASFSPDGRRVVTAAGDKTARIWDASTGAQILLLGRHEDVVSSAAFSPDGKRIVTASYDKTARIWDASTGAQIAMLRGHEDVVLSAAFSPDGRRIVTASGDKSARIWDAGTGAQIAILGGHEGPVASAAFSPDGKRIVTASSDKSVRLWDADTGAQIAILRGHEGYVRSAAFSPDGTRIVSASDDQTARIWNVGAAARIVSLRGHQNGINIAAFSPDGGRVVTASFDETARIWDANTGRQMVVLRGHEGAVLSAAFNPDGKRVVTASDDRTARIWDAATGAQLVVLRGHKEGVERAAFSPDGKRIVTSSYDQTARVWDASTGAQILVMRGREGAAFSPDGRRIVTASGDKTARIWDAGTGAQITVLRGHTGRLWSAAFSPDGSRIVTASDDRTARLWNAGTGAQIMVLRGHEGTVESAAFSPDGTRVVTASRDNTARIWDARTGEQIAVLRGHGSGVESAAFSPDGRRIVTASDDNTAQIRDVSRIILLPRAELIHRICSVYLGHGLSLFADAELRAAPELDPRLDTDACRPPSAWARLGAIFSAAF
ncbi:MAG TPA: TIR domain-containing protein [Rhizomicrobium sp.]